MSQSLAVTQSKPRARIWSWVATLGCVIFIAGVLLMHFLRPDLNPITRFASDYLNGAYGWVMVTAFMGIAFAHLGIAAAFYTAYQPPTRSKVAVILMGVSALTAILSGLFPNVASEKDVDLMTQWETISAMVHVFAGLIGFLTATIAANIFSNRLRRAKLLHGRYRALPWLAILIPVLFLIMFFLPESLGITGLVQRIFLAVILSWLMLSAAGIRSGAITKTGNHV